MKCCGIQLEYKLEPWIKTSNNTWTVECLLQFYGYILITKCVSVSQAWQEWLRRALVSVGPLDVRLLGENLAMSAGSEYEIACQTSGSRPAATLTWWKSGVPLALPTREVVRQYITVVNIGYHKKLLLPHIYFII